MVCSGPMAKGGQSKNPTQAAAPGPMLVAAAAASGSAAPTGAAVVGHPIISHVAAAAAGGSPQARQLDPDSLEVRVNWLDLAVKRFMFPLIGVAYTLGLAGFIGLYFVLLGEIKDDVKELRAKDDQMVERLQNVREENLELKLRIDQIEAEKLSSRK